MDKNISEESLKQLSKCNERIKKIYAAQGDKISMSQIKRILGVRPCIEDERLVLEKGIWRNFGA